MQCAASDSSSSIGVRRRVAGERRLDEPLRDQVRIAAIGRRRVRVVAHSETEMAGRLRARRIDDVFAGAEQANHGQREIHERLRRRLPPPRQKRRRAPSSPARPAARRRRASPHGSRMRSHRAGERTTRRSDGKPRASRNARDDAVGRDHQVFDQLLRAVRRLRLHVARACRRRRRAGPRCVSNCSAPCSWRAAIERLRRAILHLAAARPSPSPPPRRRQRTRAGRATRRRRCRRASR